ncbi:MAG: RNA polymerase sigma-70 factor [Rikenellaceae bacterium]|nr:RNA polymerase sigma-70 factor [Rikenellaceae bacterium]
MKLPDHTLGKLARGDHKAFEVVFLTYFGKVRYFIQSIIRSADDAEELAQEIFMKLWENRASVDADKPLGPFLYASARNAALNFLKHKYVVDEYAKNSVLTAAPESDGHMVIEANETELLIEMTVTAMPQQRREIYRMSRIAGKSNDEIAAELKISKKTVENQISLALKDIRRVLALLVFFLH